MLNVGDTIKCIDAVNGIKTMNVLARNGIETDFLYEKDGVKGIWLVVERVEKK